MTKSEIASKISSKIGLEKTDVINVIEALMSEVKLTMEAGENIYLRGFGTFHIKKRAEKTGRNILKNKTVIIPAHNVPVFKPAKEFSNGVKQNLPI